MTTQVSQAAPPLATKDTVPLWLAVALTVVVSLPLGLWLGRFNIALWCAFIVWAEYFALGAKTQAIKVILPSFAYAAALTGVTLFVVPYLAFLPTLVAPGDLAVAVALFVGVGALVYSMRWSKIFQEGSLPFFNGISMVLAVYFTGSFPKLLPAALAPIEAAAWAVVCAVFGVALAVFNVWLLFPKPVKD
jgi:hypothetical protein